MKRMEGKVEGDERASVISGTQSGQNVHRSTPCGGRGGRVKKASQLNDADSARMRERRREGG